MPTRLRAAGVMRCSGGRGLRRSVATLVLLALAAPALGMRLGFPDAGNDPPDTMTRRPDLITEGFGPGTNGPLVIAADWPTRPRRTKSTPWHRESGLRTASISSPTRSSAMRAQRPLSP